MVAGHHRDAEDGCGGEHAVQEGARTAGDPDLDREHSRELGLHPCRQPDAAAQHVGLAEAGPQVVASGDALLQRGGVVGPGGLLDDLALGDERQQRAYGGQGRHSGQREEHERRPPGQPGHQPQRTRGEDRADRLPAALAQQGADLVGVVVDPVEHLADGLLGQGLERLVHRGVEQVGAQPALGPVDHARPQGAREGVEHGRTDDAEREQLDPGRRGVLGQQPGHVGAERHADSGHRARHQRPDRDRVAQPTPVDGALGVRWRGRRGADCTGRVELCGHRSRRYVESPTVVAWFTGAGRPRPSLVA